MGNKISIFASGHDRVTRWDIQSQDERTFPPSRALIQVSFENIVTECIPVTLLHGVQPRDVGGVTREQGAGSPGLVLGAESGGLREAELRLIDSSKGEAFMLSPNQFLLGSPHLSP